MSELDPSLTVLKVKAHPMHEGIFVSPDGDVYRRLSASPSTGGYHTVKVGNGETIRRHRLVLETFKGPSNGRLTRHLDGNPANDSSSNLEWGTQKENLADAVLHGTTTKGEKNARAKVTSDDVLEIRRRLIDGESIQNLSKEFGISDACIYDIRAKRTWGWL